MRPWRRCAPLGLIVAAADQAVAEAVAEDAVEVAAADEAAAEARRGSRRHRPSCVDHGG